MRDHDLLVTEADEAPQGSFYVFAEDEAHDNYGHEGMGPPRESKWRRAMTAPGITRSAHPSGA